MKLSAIILLLLSGYVTVEAQESATQPATQTLTLSNSVEIALEKNVTVIQARNNLEASQSGTRAAVGAFFPTLEASAGYQSQHQWYPDYDGDLNNSSYNTNLHADMILFNGLANTNSLKRAEADETAAELTVTRSEQSTIYQTHFLFLNVFRTYQLLNVFQDNLKRSKRQLERIQESNKVGAVALADVYRQQVQAGKDELALIQAQSAYEKAKQDHVAYLGVDFTSEYTFDFTGVPRDIDTTEFAALNASYSNFQNLVAEAVQRRPDFLASTENVNSADNGVTVARAGHWPTISASASYGLNNTRVQNLIDNKNFLVNLNLTLPIFNGFSTSDRVEQAEILRKNAEEQHRQSNRQLAVDIRKALLDLEASEKQVRVTQSNVFSAEMDRKIAEEKYNLGAGTLLDLLVATANYTGALSDKVDAVISFLLAKKNTELALGTISK